MCRFPGPYPDPGTRTSEGWEQGICIHPLPWVSLLLSNMGEPLSMFVHSFPTSPQTLPVCARPQMTSAPCCPHAILMAALQTRPPFCAGSGEAQGRNGSSSLCPQPLPQHSRPLSLDPSPRAPKTQTDTASGGPEWGGPCGLPHPNSPGGTEGPSWEPPALGLQFQHPAASRKKSYGSADPGSGSQPRPTRPCSGHRIQSPRRPVGACQSGPGLVTALPSISVPRPPLGDQVCGSVRDRQLMLIGTSPLSIAGHWSPLESSGTP